MNKEMFRWIIITALLVILTGAVLTVLGLPGFINRAALLVIVGSLLLWWATHLEE